MTPAVAGIVDVRDVASARRVVADEFGNDRVVVAGPLAVLGHRTPQGVHAFAGYLTNLGELRSGAAVEDSGELAAQLVRDEGTDGIARLRGTFVLAAWDDGTQRGVVATDHLGAGGLFYASDGGRLVFASEIRDVLRLLRTTPGPNEDALVQWLANDAPALGDTLYESVHRLRGGEAIELRADGWRMRSYWQPRYEPLPAWTDEDAAEAVRVSATAAVETRVADRGGTGVLMSGGIDSSSIAAFASQRSIGLRGYSAVFPDDPDMDESELVQSVAQTLGMPLTMLAVHDGSALGPALAYLDAWRVPSLSPNLVFATPLARAAGDSGVSVLLDGEGGDELFGFSTYVFADLLSRGRLARALRLAERIPGMADQPRTKAMRWVMREWGVKGTLPYVVHAVSRRMRPLRYGAPWLLPTWARRHGGHVYTWDWKRRRGPRWWAGLVGELVDARQRFGAHDFLRHKSAMAGVEGRHPYFEDVDLTERVLSLPPEAAFDPGLDRPLLRRATAGLLPDEVRLRGEKSYFDSLFQRALESTDRPALERLLGKDAAVGRHVRLDVVRGYLEGATDRPEGWRWIVWRVAAAECWLRALADPAFAERAPAEWGLAAPRLELVKLEATAPSSERTVSA